MSNVKKTTSIILLVIVLAIMTVALYLGIPSNAVKFASAENETTYHNYELILHTLPFPMQNIENVDKYKETLSGITSEGKEFKLFNIELYETVQRGKRDILVYLGTIPLKVTVRYDTGYCFYPRTATGDPVHWRDDEDWATYVGSDGTLYGVMSTSTDSEEYLEDMNFWFEFQTLHKFEGLVINVVDPFTNGSILTSVIDENHVEIETYNYETNNTRDSAIPLFINNNDTELSFEDGYDAGFIDGEIEGQKNAMGSSNEYQLGYDTGYDVGHKEGYKQGSYDVNLELSNVTGTTIGAVADFIMNFLTFEIAGISVWSILAILGGVIIIGIVIKLAT